MMRVKWINMVDIFFYTCMNMELWNLDILIRGKKRRKMERMNQTGVHCKHYKNVTTKSLVQKLYTIKKSKTKNYSYEIILQFNYN
jgi:hypothetical protein